MVLSVPDVGVDVVLVSVCTCMCAGICGVISPDVGVDVVLVSVCMCAGGEVCRGSWRGHLCSGWLHHLMEGIP